jgi:hypothetical protein
MSTDKKSSNPDEKKPFFGLTIETGLFLALLTAGCYYISFYKVSTFYGRLGIPLSLLDYTFDEIITYNVAFLASCIVFSIIILKELEDSKVWSKINWLCCNIPFFLMLISSYFILTIPSLDFPSSSNICVLILIIITVFILIITFREKMSLLGFMWQRDVLSKLIAILLILMGFGFFAMVLGDYEVIGLIECKEGACAHINFTFKDQNLSYINSDKLILITQHKGKYFLSKQERPIPKNPEIYIVTDDQILSVRTKMVRNWSDPKEIAFNN